jgi:hypothetical protein
MSLCNHEIRADPGKNLPGCILPVQVCPGVRAARSIRAKIRADPGNSIPRSLRPLSRLRRDTVGSATSASDRPSGYLDD